MEKVDIFAEQKKPFDWRGPCTLLGGFMIHLVLGKTNINT
jgi:hypothetical protein